MELQAANHYEFSGGEVKGILDDAAPLTISLHHGGAPLKDVTALFESDQGWMISGEVSPGRGNPDLHIFLPTIFVTEPFTSHSVHGIGIRITALYDDSPEMAGPQQSITTFTVTGTAKIVHH